MKQFIRKNIDLHRKVTPSLGRVEQFLGLNTYVPDHVAFRTFKSLGGINLFHKYIETHYSEMDTYDFPSKELIGKWYRPNVAGLPRLFISQIEDNKLSEKSQNIIWKYALPKHKMPCSELTKESEYIPICMIKSDYEILMNESQYAAWTLLHGCLINHVGISLDSVNSVNSVNRANGIESLEELNRIMESYGFNLLDNGKGKIKISTDGLLKQSSIVSDKQDKFFRITKSENSDLESIRVSGGFVEFVERYREGFETENAFEIFDSTNVHD